MGGGKREGWGLNSTLRRETLSPLFVPTQLCLFLLLATSLLLFALCISLSLFLETILFFRVSLLFFGNDSFLFLICISISITISILGSDTRIRGTNWKIKLLPRLRNEWYFFFFLREFLFFFFIFLTAIGSLCLETILLQVPFLSNVYNWYAFFLSFCCLFLKRIPFKFRCSTIQISATCRNHSDLIRLKKFL